MDREKVYDYFMLQANLWQAVMNWHREKIKDTEFKNTPYKIKFVNLVDGGCLNIGIEYIETNKTNQFKEYRFNIKELENV
jgi:hypothetical protein